LFQNEILNVLISGFVMPDVDFQKINKLNYDTILVKIKATIIEEWNKRNLTPVGKNTRMK
jgi:hypothetical protein